MVSRFVLIIAIAGLAIVNVGCETGTSNSELVPMHTGNPELRRELLAELDKRQILYNVIDDSHVEVEYKDAALIGEIFNGIIRNVLPRDRSFIPAPYLLGELTEALRDKNISCKSVHAFDDDWVVCDSEDMRVANEIWFEIVMGDEGVQSSDPEFLSGLHVFSDYGSKYRYIHENPTEETIRTMIRSLDWVDGFHQVLLVVSPGISLEVGGSLNPEDGLHSVYRDWNRGIPKVTKEPPTTVENMEELLVSFHFGDGRWQQMYDYEDATPIHPFK